MTVTDSRALAVPLLLVRVEDGLEAARVEVYEDLVGVDGLVTAVLPLQRRRNALVRSPLRNKGPAKFTKERGRVYGTNINKMSRHCNQVRSTTRLWRTYPGQNQIPGKGKTGVLGGGIRARHEKGETETLPFIVVVSKRSEFRLPTTSTASSDVDQ